jgi:hypothetical protein
MQSADDALSPDKLLGLTKGASAPYFFAIDIILELSDETTILSIYLLF